MQLTRLNRRKSGPIAAALGMLTASLLAADPVLAQGADGSDQPSLMNEPAAELGSRVIDTSVLFYQERGGRVRATEPSLNYTAYFKNGDVATGSLTYDSLTGATPNGAAPWTSPQTFTSIIPAPSLQVTTTSASGGSVLTTIPGTGTVQRTYIAPAGAIPLDYGFHDHRIAGSFGYSYLATDATRFKWGGSLSFERDYTSVSGNVGISHDFNQKNTTVAISANLEYDWSKPFYGTPSAYQTYASQITGGKDHKTVLSVVAGVTQVMTRFWLTELNYSVGDNKGYQTDPYRILSVVDATTGAPLNYLYESRPRTRTRQSIYWGNKLAIGPTVADLSLRYYHDSWGINSITAEASEQIPLMRSLYVEPSFRYYHQGAANFFRNYLVNGAALPQYASSDSRLGRFSATTVGVKVGWRLLSDTELYVNVEDYRQTGAHFDPTAPGALATLDLFSGVHAFNVMSGFKLKFR